MDFVVASAAGPIVDVAEADSEAASRIDQALALAEEALAIKAEEASHPEVDMVAIVAGLVEVEIAVGMAATSFPNRNSDFISATTTGSASMAGPSSQREKTAA